jgi:hypothetical protein
MPPAAVRLRKALSLRPRRRVVNRKVEVKEERMAQAEALDISRLVDERASISAFFVCVFHRADRRFDIAAP